VHIQCSSRTDDEGAWPSLEDNDFVAVSMKYTAEVIVCHRCADVTRRHHRNRLRVIIIISANHQQQQQQHGRVDISVFTL